MNESTLTIDDLSLPVLRPGSVGELADTVRHAADSGSGSATAGAIYPFGGKTRLGTGLPPARPGVAVDLRLLTQVIDYPARDMTITVEAGITLSALQQILAAEGQRLPIDVPLPEQATLGGAIAANVSGPRRFGSGTLRDYVIGITTLNDRGEQTKAGGRVVKNVAGYDLCKLHTGAFGTLGVITQVTLKVRPIPEESALVTFCCTSEALAHLLDVLHASRTRPMCVDLLNAPAAADLRRRTGLAIPDQPWVLLVGFEDNEHSVNWQVQQILHELPACGVKGVEAVAGSTAAPLWQALTEITSRPEAKLSLKAGVLPAQVAGWCVHVAGQSPQATPPVVHAHAGSGIVHVHYFDLTAEQATDMLNSATVEAQKHAGYVTVPHCPTAWKRHLPVWGAPREDAWLMREVKRKLDPKGLFNPGRFP